MDLYKLKRSEREHISKIDKLVYRLTKDGRLSEFWNGVGSGLPILSCLKPPTWICDLFSDPSKFHDVAYCVGGNSEVKDLVDAEFLARCNWEIRKLGWWKRLVASFWIRVDDDVLRNFGSLSFSFREAPDYELEKNVKNTR